MKRRSFTDSFLDATRGIIFAIYIGRNMKIHILAAFTAVIMGFLFQITGVEWAILMLTIFMVLTAETINTAIEKTVDLITDSYHPLARWAKNLAAGGVLLTAINAVIIAGLVFGPRLTKIFQVIQGGK